MGMGTPTFMIPPSFMGFSDRRPQSSINVVGIPYDLGTSNRPGTRFGPAAIRQASRMLVDGMHPFHWVDPKDLNIGDLGDFQIVQGHITDTLAAITEQARDYEHLITLGGDHSISLALLRQLQEQYKGPVGLVHFDAHLDTWPDNFGGVPYGHGNPFFHAVEEVLIDPKRMVQIGIRSPVDKEVWDWTINKGSTVLTASNVQSWSLDAIIDIIRQKIGTGRVYLTIDIDVLDPAFAPGTGTPEVGGLQTWQVQEILRGLTDLNWVGMDVVEVSPPYDVAEVTALAAATFVWEYLSILGVQMGG